MISNENQLAITQERIARFLGILSQLRASCRPDELPLVASGYRTELERMQKEVLDYLSRHTSARIV
jgi:hypothetical protein